MYLFYNLCTTLHVSNGYFVHHQEFMIDCICSCVQTVQTCLTAWSYGWNQKKKKCCSPKTCTQRACLSACTFRSLLCCKVDVYNQCSRNELHVECKPRTIRSLVNSPYAFCQSAIRSLTERVKPDSLLDILHLCKTRNLLKSSRLGPILDK